LGHVFTGEGFTSKNRRYCVNSLSLDLVANENVTDSNEAILAGGCFWGVEHFLAKIDGVLKVESGYTGGRRPNPTYEQVCSGASGHYEAVRVLFDPTRTNFETVCRTFFEIHDPTQSDGQGPDIGSQYLSAVFVLDEDQKRITESLIKKLEDNGLHIATKVLPATTFWEAEDYHQSYYNKNGKTPYCHRYTKRF
jgi:peptide methionine sulfoxide reductase msrA/msrB